MEHADDALPLPSVEALFAATLALMTSWAAPCPTARINQEALRHLMAKKVVSNLFFLQRHPGITDCMRSMLAQVHAHWQSIASEPATQQTPGSVDERPPALH